MFEIAAVGNGHGDFFDRHLLPKCFHQIELRRAAWNTKLC
jgi:hypothetical protein